MKRVVALKVLPSALTKTFEAVQRFEREVEVAARLGGEKGDILLFCDSLRDQPRTSAR